jgi:hypothetical protein
VTNSELRRLQTDPQLVQERIRRLAPPELYGAVSIEVERRAPAGWRLRMRGGDGEHWMAEQWRLSMIWSLSLEDDGNIWLHASLAHGKRLPERPEMGRVKDWVFGPARWAYEVWPPEAAYVNLREVLHLWGRLDGSPVLPEFSALASDGTRTI